MKEGSKEISIRQASPDDAAALLAKSATPISNGGC